MKVGQVVNLKSGGAIMTIIGIEDGLITCMWTDNTLQPHQIEVPEDALEDADLVEG